MARKLVIVILEVLVLFLYIKTAMCLFIKKKKSYKLVTYKFLCIRVNDNQRVHNPKGCLKYLSKYLRSHEVQQIMKDEGQQQ
jgi:hypothetical protein